MIAQAGRSDHFQLHQFEMQSEKYKLNIQLHIYMINL